MAASLGGGCGTTAWIPLKRNVKKNSERNNKRFNVTCGASVLTDPYKTLRINQTASESEVRKAFRHLALQYHPDVCRGSNCDVQFHQINEAYDVVMSNLRGRSEREIFAATKEYEYDPDEAFTGMNDPDWDMWEEWMGWEGAGIRDYTSHINHYL